jgi:SAM-dependent methyltransferase
MSEDVAWGSEQGHQILNKRSLDNFFPGLKPYLFSNASVLDVGCGPGTVTAGVAVAVRPGQVVGVDFAEQSIRQAQALAQELQIANATFQVMNAYDLRFTDETFDITYSHNVLVWLNDPIRALQEQKRVTKRGGMVIAGIGDWGTVLIYPPCPALQTIFSAMAHLNDPTDPDTFVNYYLGREAVKLFSSAGLDQIRIHAEVTPMECVYPGSAHFEDRLQYLKLIANTNPDNPIKALHRKLMSLGHVDQATYQAAQQEIEQWYTHPHAFQMEARMIAVGQVV